MDTQHAQSQDLTNVEQMSQVGAGEMLARKAIAIIFNRPEVRFVSTSFDADASFACESGSVSGYARGQDTVKHINSTRYELHQLCGRAQPHRIPWLCRRQERLGNFYGSHHFGLRFAHAYSANRVAVKVEFDQCPGAFLPQVGVDSALNDAKDLLPFCPWLFPA